MTALFKYILEWFSPKKNSIEAIDDCKKLPVDHVHQEITLTCDQIKQSIESIHSDMRHGTDDLEMKIFHYRQLVINLDKAMQVR